LSTESPLDVQIPDEAIEATAEMIHKLFGMKGHWVDLSEKRKDVRRGQARKLLLAGGYQNPEGMKAVGYAHCAQRAGAAVRLVSPDHITPMGERQIRKAVEDNPYTRTPEKEAL
jgi:hypothetical protein